MIINKPPNSDHYDADYLDYCCLELKHLVIGDGGSIKLTDKGLILNPNLPNQPKRLQYCPMCGTKVEHEDNDSVKEQPVSDTKPILRDKGNPLRSDKQIDEGIDTPVAEKVTK